MVRIVQITACNIVGLLKAYALAMQFSLNELFIY